MSNTMKARIAYTGSALNNGEMDVRELAPALLAFADLVKYANHEIGGKGEIKVAINQDSIQAGSFDLTFLLNTNILNETTTLVGMANNNGLSDLLTVLGWGVNCTAVGGAIFSVFKFIRELSHKQVDDVEYILDNQVKIKFHDGNTIVTTKNTFKVYGNIDCRKAIENIVKPVKEHEGIDGFELRTPDNQSKDPIEKITKNEAYIYDVPVQSEPEESLKTQEQERLVQIISVNFEHGKWRLTDGDTSFWANIQDNDFLRKIENNELRFGKGDMLLVVCYIKQYVKNGKLSSETIVTQVKDIRRKPLQLKLPF